METKIKKNSPDLGDIFREYGEMYISKYNVSPQEKGILRLLSMCRTDALGTHLMQCNHCGYMEICCNSCGNRHCPNCQHRDKEKWFEKRKEELLPVNYFHIVFTVPSQLNDIVLQNKKVMYNILFRAASECLKELARDPKHVGARTGMICVLHTWGQNLREHPHLHCIVPAGGLSTDNQHWVHSRPDYFIPVQLISSLFRGKFLAFLKEAHLKNQLKFFGSIKRLQSKISFSSLVYNLYKKDWVVFSQKPFSRPEKVLEYISRYINRVALTNRKIIKLQNDRVTILWKDYHDNKSKRMTLDVDEFIRRFLLHILPKGLCKVRYYGIFANHHRKQNIEHCRTALNNEKQLLKEENAQDGIVPKEQSPDIWDELLKLISFIDVPNCPKCKKGQMVFCGLVKNRRTG